VKFGIFDHMDRAQPDLARQYSDRLRLIRAYDLAGFYAYHLAEHHGTPLGLAPSPGLFLAAAAQHCERLRLGPLVYTLPQYHPLRLAEEICMLDHASNGRLELGIGRGISPIELGFYGLGADEARERFAEAHAVVIRALTSERLSFDGAYYRFEDVPMVVHPRQRPHPPLWYGVSKPESCAWAAANEMNVVSNGTLEVVRAIVAAYRAEWSGAGLPLARLPLIGIGRHIVIAERASDARELAREAYAQWLDSLLLLWRERGIEPPLIAYPATAGQAIDDGFILAGTAVEVRRGVEELVATTGVNYLLCRFAFGGLPVEASLRSTELFAGEVMPAFPEAA
jgi:alkanesulfonate monooxygenase SsuD/methylene tetrahydromethanopterin reductase-like flavin-dependent oxidoreductase (luciferase family)